MRAIPRFSDQDADLARRKWLYAHRAVAERMLGRPLTVKDIVDHINFDRLDNRRENLRVGTWKQNSQHRRSRNPTGLRGVTFNKARGKWQASVKHNDKSIYCGLHDTPEAAGAAAATKRAELGFPDGGAA